MNSRERLTRCFFGLETDRPAVYVRSGYPSNDCTYDDLKQYMATNSDLKKIVNGRIEKDYPVKTQSEYYSKDYVREITTLDTPMGELSCSRYISLNGNSSMSETHLIKTREDAEKYLSLPIPEMEGDISFIADAVREMGERGIVDVSLGINPAGSVAQLIGSENFAIMTLTDRDIIHALCERQLEIIMNTAKFLIGNKIGPFFSMSGEELIVPPLHGVKDFYDFNVRYDKPIIDLVHEAGGRMHIHCHGSVGKVLDGFLEMGTDVLHPFEAPPMGDITASEAKRRVRGKICIEGNIQIAHMYEHTPEQIREETEELIRDAYDDHRGLIVCPTASAYIYGKGGECLKQFKSMVETVINMTPNT